ncbi:class I SAM-dependent methyltransferase [Cohnella sp. REN36]|uniref:tRNA (adenine(22)-N(1))-methyltransferase n=1 Tax=Cohnella sp. REN36 TaxID=2887347 RepID=UPI001D15DBD6|nr:class I SAM-dependent methyltransferase [Cohnella sp. REN36]MCC3372815.1 class I SAM-dependent methyltransferase [Cohnella sp. REN36]
MNESKEYAAGLKLSRRLAALADWVPEGARFADIGTDHALLPVYLAAIGRIPFAVAGDVHAGPAEAARRQVEAAGLSGVVSVRLGDGLSVLSPGEVDTVCIAGMGGSLMVRLLEAAGPRLQGVRTLILSPHVAEDQVRRWLVDRQYALEDERLLAEDGETYTLMRAVYVADAAEAAARNDRLYDEALLTPRCPDVPRELLLAMGPLLLREAGETFRAKWRAELAKREKILAQLRLGQSAGAEEKARAWEEESRRIEEVLSCTQEGRPLSN